MASAGRATWRNEHHENKFGLKQRSTPLRHRCFWWMLSDGPLDVRTDAATGVIIWTPEDCAASFTLQVLNDVGADEQSWSYVDPDPGDTDDTDTDDTASGADPEDGGGTTPPSTSSDGCGCASAPLSATVFLFLPLIAARRR